MPAAAARAALAADTPPAEEVGGTTPPNPSKAARNDMSGLLLSSLTTGLTGIAGLVGCIGLACVLTGVCHGLLLDLSLLSLDDGVILLLKSTFG